MSINKNLFQRVQGIILMYDISREEIFKNLNTWMNHIKENSSGIPVILIENKSDLDSERQVSKEQGKNSRKKIKWFFSKRVLKVVIMSKKSFFLWGNSLSKMTTLFKVKKNQPPNTWLVKKLWLKIMIKKMLLI